MTVAAWKVLDDELAAWGETGRTVTLWWRDDDATAATPQLDRLLALAAETRVPVSLAAIPDAIAPSLADALDGRDNDASVLVHGFAHENNAGGGEKKCEFPVSRRAAVVSATLQRGRETLAAMFGPAALPVFVPPWNRLDDAWLPDLTACGYVGLSRFGPRGPASGALRQVNTHVDPILWHGGKGFIGLDAALDALTGHLRDRRTGACDSAEPTGLLTHHLVQDTETWDFVADLFARTAEIPHLTWLPGPAVFDHTSTHYRE